MYLAERVPSHSRIKHRVLFVASGLFLVAAGVTLFFARTYVKRIIINRPVVFVKASAGMKSGSASKMVNPGLTDRIGLAYGDNLVSLNSKSLNTYMADAKKLGVGWIRFDVAWDNVQPKNSATYNWTSIDRIVSAANTYGLRSLPIIDYTPAWARPVTCQESDTCAPASSVAFATFAARATERYASLGVHDWEVWNEPNIEKFWQPTPSPKNYTSLLQATYASIKSVDPTANVISGGLSQPDGNNASLAPVPFLTAMYADGAKGYFDNLGDHPYTYPLLPNVIAGNNAWQGMSQLTAIMQSNGDIGKKIWVTEYGAPTGGPGQLASNGTRLSSISADHVTEQLQAQMLNNAMQFYLSNPNLGAFFWYSYKDLGTNTNTIENFFGLVRANGTKKPAYTALQNQIQGISQ